MRYVITASKLNHLRSESVGTAAHGVDVATDFYDAGFMIVSILDDRYHQITIDELKAAALDEARHISGSSAT